MAKNLLFIIFLYSSVVWAQKINSLSEDIFVRTANIIAPKDPQRALQIADSITKTAKTSEIKGRGFLLSANILFFHDKYDESLKFAERAKKIFDKTENYELQARVRGLLAEEYRFIRLPHKSKGYLEEGLKISDKITDPKKQAMIKARFFAELIEGELTDDHVDQALKHQLQSLNYLSKIPEDTLNTGHAYHTLGTIYTIKHNYEQAKVYFLKAIKILPESTHDKALAYIGLAKVLINDGDYDEAEKILFRTLNFAETAQNSSIKKIVFRVLADLYEKKNDFEKASLYRKKYAETLHDALTDTSEFVDENYNRFEKQNQEYADWDSIQNIVIGIAVLLILGLLTISIINRKKHKEEYKKFKNILMHYKEKAEYVLETKVDTSHIEETENEEETVAEEIESEKIPAEIAINKETETHILTQLERFEKEELYNNSQISLSYLAMEFNTNIRYISYVVKKYKGTDFKNYINKLRINYIIHKLNTSEKYRKYKVGALAEECGFSSHSKFTTIFKSITGISPSAFIAFAEQENAKKKTSN
ncbi:Tetratricopeptide repeat-containing protein [Chryseobacterium arachidis]|uniref:Tetratricopeptide repeat-containing protein n=1 Tax=Chryseobacterium arachidis TaxID=1416778 RepID=A0A1M4TLD7_9FLAO|nr:helix-turn-helix domain-containing protein [Chryseobacterium arachidis]SHE45281.1 Tetratricopeptide repeat-containing protein [Chryseobacterium arachidis]